MFFILSKTVTVLMQPSNLILLIGVAGLILLLMRWRRAGVSLLVTSALLLLAAGVSPLGIMLIRNLEDRFPQPDAMTSSAIAAPTGIIILGGALSPSHSRGPGAPGLNMDGGRIVAIARLAKQYPQARILFSGGDASLVERRTPEADALPPLLADLGVPAGRVEFENKSRNTAENASFSKDILQPKPGEKWLLVTSAWHMPRSIGCFRAVGFDVVAYPVAYQTDRRLQVWPSVTVGRNLERLDRAVNEWIGLIAYRLTGRTTALFPEP